MYAYYYSSLLAAPIFDFQLRMLEVDIGRDSQNTVLPKCRILSEYFGFIALSADSRTNDAFSRIFSSTLALQYNAAISTADQLDACASTYTFSGCGYLLEMRNYKTVYNYYLRIFVY